MTLTARFALRLPTQTARNAVSSSSEPSFIRALVVVVSLLALAACRQDMHDQPKYRPLRESEGFSDRRSARPLVAGTIARGMLREDAAFFTGKNDDGFLTALPMPVTTALLERGRERFEIFCAVCHGRTGRGDGIVVQRGFKQPPSFHAEQLRVMPVGFFYDVMTNGFGAMPDYAPQVAPADRWAIAGYIRVLQYSQYAPAADLPAAEQAELDKSIEPAPAPASGSPREERH